jgi:hypothetical protein
VDTAAGDSVTRSWVALDVNLYQYNASTGSAARGERAGHALQSDSGLLVFARLYRRSKFNWRPRAGVLLGVRIISIRRNTSTSMTPRDAINLVLRHDGGTPSFPKLNSA